MGSIGRFSSLGVLLGANSSASEAQNVFHQLCLSWQEKGKKTKKTPKQRKYMSV